MAKKKVVLFIVEGVNDELALALPLERLLSNELVKVEVTEGDITTKYSNEGIVARIGAIIKKHISVNKYQTQDYAEVVLLVDTDGAYINQDSILYDNLYDEAYYDNDTIRYINPEGLEKTHLQKCRNLNHLISLPKVYNNIPFSVYFFSCNLDHVICNDANLTRSGKAEVANNFRSKYVNDLKGFHEFFSSLELSIGYTYDETWSFIKFGTNSLQRCSNFNVFLSMEAKQIKRDFSSVFEN
ncbi:MAG: hypothetical protein FWG88_09595 [Oscillospiraceae bacterium]|nr:hypothetical protein [Oscillospiraceae bacterium]